MKYLRNVLAILLLTSFSSVYGGSCYYEKPYDMDDCRVLAEQGEAKAQNKLGVMYYDGEVVPKDYKEAVKWYRKSAEQGNHNAQLNLGGAYYHGHGAPKDIVMAYMFINLATVSGKEYLIPFRDMIEKKMTPSQIEKAQDLAREWMRTH